MSTILFYVSFSRRSRDTETLMIAFKRQGHNVLFLNQQKNEQLHTLLRSHGITTHSFSTGSKGWLKHIINVVHLSFFCWSNNVDFVYSHLEPASFIGVLAQKFIRAKVYVCRHHGDLYSFMNKDKDLSYQMTYRFASTIIVVSESTKKYMVEKEGIKSDRIKKINLAYDFSLYDFPDPDKVNLLRKNINANVILITVGHFNAFKRPQQSIEVLRNLLQLGIDAKLILLGNGEQEDEIRCSLKTMNIQDRVIMPGFVNNVIDYLAASSVLLHPSVSESSCVVVKEAGLVQIPVVVCKGVGDFDEFIVDGDNGFLVDRDQFSTQAASLVNRISKDQALYDNMGRNLKRDVLQLFDIKNILPVYDQIHNKESTN